MQRRQTAIIERESDGYVSLCPELDIASQGNTVQEARDNLQEALALFFETASPEEIQQRLHKEIGITVPVPNHTEIRIGTLQSIIRQSGIPKSAFEA
ncbi:MAG: type II toxin-antitoxin system HicA family toxin [Candidatus Competibacter denitrificans]